MQNRTKKHFLSCLSHVHGKFMEMISLKSSGELFFLDSVFHLFDLRMGETKRKTISIISDFLDRSPSPNTNYLILGDTSIPRKINETHDMFGTYYF